MAEGEEECRRLDGVEIFSHEHQTHERKVAGMRTVIDLAADTCWQQLGIPYFSF